MLQNDLALTGQATVRSNLSWSLLGLAFTGRISVPFGDNWPSLCTTLL